LWLANEKKICEVTEIRLMIGWVYFEVFVAAAAAGISWYDLMMIGKFKKDLRLQKHMVGKLVSLRWEPGEGFSCVMVVVAILLVYTYDLILDLITHEVRKEAGRLEFDTVDEADASVESDRAKLQAAVAEDREDVEHAIKVLKAVGRYDESVQFNLDRALSVMDIRHGINPFKILLGVFTWEFWWMTELARFQHRIYATIVPGVTCLILLAIVYGPKTMKHGSPTANDRYCFAVSSFMWSGVLFSIISNQHYFFNDAAVKEASMTRGTLWLQGVMWLLLMLQNAYFYLGCQKRLETMSQALVRPDEDSSDDGESDEEHSEASEGLNQNYV